MLWVTTSIAARGSAPGRLRQVRQCEARARPLRGDAGGLHGAGHADRERGAQSYISKGR